MNKVIHLHEVLTADDINKEALKGAKVEDCKIEETDFDMAVLLIFKKGNQRYALKFCTCGEIFFGEGER